jgi:hypothetical protein
MSPVIALGVMSVVHRTASKQNRGKFSSLGKTNPYRSARVKRMSKKQRKDPLHQSRVNVQQPFWHNGAAAEDPDPEREGRRLEAEKRAIDTLARGKRRGFGDKVRRDD